MCIDHSSSDASSASSAASSYLVFASLAVAVPCAALAALPTRRAYDTQVQASLTLSAALAYATLYSLVRRRGLRRLLYLDRLRHDSQDVRAGYVVQLAGSFRLLACFVLPCFLAHASYKVFWYCANRPFGGGAYRWWWNAAACALEMASWMYRTAIFFMACVLFRTICYLQILRMTGFARDFGQCADVAAVLRQHRRIRVQLRRISHRYRRFILYCLILVTVSQFTALLAATRPHAQVNLAIAGELALCSMSLVTGLLICLHSAAKITHKTQSITSVAAAWHADATINSLERDQENPRTPSKAFLQHQHAPASPFPVASASSGEESDDDESRSEDSVDTSRFASFHVTNISFQKRQALVTYLENNRAGITVFGFVVDRTWLHALFMIEFSLVMWLLGKTIGIS
ncbi:hypothetical protein HU200_032055 [Digitaria exilis]|uniref:Gustatory receptor n=1 Tax=Digitaria exilis TaxID=1010633 RepID=A0A835BZ42_9POAL|nr:hypothetical protein HU200_032055 [Digitaria exilis]